MKQYTAWQAPFYSFWSKSFYIDVAKHWHGLAYGYLFALVCFTWIFMSVKKQMDITYIADHDLYPILEQMPKVTIDKGILSIDKPSPLTLTNGNGVPIVTFDTREKPMELSEVPSNFLVARDGVYYKSSSQYHRSSQGLEYTRERAKEEKLDLSTIDHQVIDKNSARQFISDLCKSIGLIVFLIAVPFAFVFSIIQTLFYGLIGKLIARFNKVDLSYGTLIRLSAVALTPVLLIDSIIKVRGLDINIWTLCSLAYFIFAVGVNIMNQDNKPELSNP